MARNPVPHKWTIEEYLNHEEETGIKHEYIDGEIYAMSGGTDNHTVITMNASGTLFQTLRDADCIVRTSDMRVKISDIKYLYPDFTVVCGEAIFADNNRTMLTNPTVVVEVMSPSSASYDKGAKWDYYRSLESLQVYLLLDQSHVHAQLYTRQETGWLMREYSDLDENVPLDALDCTLPLSEVYRGITFDTEDQE